MAFRDDREALFARIEALRQETEKERERNKQREGELQKESERLQRLLHEERRRTTRPSRLRWAVALGALVVLSLTCWLVTRRPVRSRILGSSFSSRRQSKPKEPLQEARYWALRHYDPSQRPGALAAVAGAHMSLGDRTLAEQVLQESSKQLLLAKEKATTPRHRAHLAASHGAVGCARWAVRQKKDLVQYLKAMEEQARKAHSYLLEHRAYLDVARRCRAMGVEGVALQVLRRASEAAGKLSNFYSRATHLVEVASLLQEMGARSELAALADRTRELVKPDEMFAPLLYGQLAMRLWQAGDSKRAKEALARARQRRYPSAMERAEVGRALAVMGKSEEARRYLEQVLDQHRRGVSASQLTLTAIALGYVALGEIKRALDISEHDSVLLQVVRSHLQAGRADAAVQVAGRIKQKSQELSLLLARAGRKEALDVARRLVVYTERAVALAEAWALLGR